VTTNAARATTLIRALRAAVEGDGGAVPALFTDDVKAWAPGMSAGSAAELAAEFARRDDAFSAIDIEVFPLDVSGPYACVEWSVSMTHSGTLVIGDELTVEPTGLSISLHGATIAEFRGDRICALRQYWDELALLDQLGVPAKTT
jgi:ketosteroid isomerase-like protein